VDDGRRRLRRGGYLTCEAAAAARERLSVPARSDPGGAVYTVAQWLEAWIETRARLRHNTRRVYKSHIRQHLRRVFHGVLLKELDVARVEQAFTRLFSEGMTAATARRVFSTLRTALNAAVREGLIPRSPARYVKLPRGRRPFAVVWTKRRVENGGRPANGQWSRSGRPVSCRSSCPRSQGTRCSPRSG